MPKIDINSYIGKEYGSLTIVSPVLLNNEYPKEWVLRCVCGVMVTNSLKKIHTLRITSCGCVGREMRKLSSISQRTYSSVTINSQYQTHKHSSRNVTHGFLPKDIWMSIVFKPCHYCGNIDNKNVGKKRGNKYSKLNQSELVKYSVDINGVDRLDNMLGYTIYNCVPCCKTCNFMKGRLTTDGFVDKIKLISLNMKLYDK